MGNLLSSSPASCSAPSLRALFTFMVLLTSCVLVFRGLATPAALLLSVPLILHQAKFAERLGNTFLLTLSLVFSEETLTQKSQGQVLVNKILHLVISVWTTRCSKVTVSGQGHFKVTMFSSAL